MTVSIEYGDMQTLTLTLTLTLPLSNMDICRHERGSERRDSDGLVYPQPYSIEAGWSRFSRGPLKGYILSGMVYSSAVWSKARLCGRARLDLDWYRLSQLMVGIWDLNWSLLRF